MPHNEPCALMIDLPDPSSSDQSIKLLSFHSGDSFVFLDLPLARIVDQSAAYQSVAKWLTAIATSHCGFEPSGCIGNQPQDWSKARSTCLTHMTFRGARFAPSPGETALGLGKVKGRH